MMNDFSIWTACHDAAKRRVVRGAFEHAEPKPYGWSMTKTPNPKPQTLNPKKFCVVGRENETRTARVRFGQGVFKSVQGYPNSCRFTLALSTRERRDGNYLLRQPFADGAHERHHGVGAVSTRFRGFVRRASP